jgi:hypothetical protein
MSEESSMAAFKAELYGLIAHWGKLAEHAKQPPLARKVIQDLTKELKKAVDRR